MRAPVFAVLVACSASDGAAQEAHAPDAASDSAASDTWAPGDSVPDNRLADSGPPETRTPAPDAVPIDGGCSRATKDAACLIGFPYPCGAASDGCGGTYDCGVCKGDAGGRICVRGSSYPTSGVGACGCLTVGGALCKTAGGAAGRTFTCGSGGDIIPVNPDCRKMKTDSTSTDWCCPPS